MCRVNIPAGVRATWHPARRVVTCLTCGVKAGAGGLDTPGASARREYDRRRAAREDRARQTLGLLGVVLAKTIDEPQSTRAWKTGADGEGRVGKRLAKLLAGTEVRLLHDRRIPGHGAANIDHLAVGPGGITVIDTKSYRGKVRTERIGGLFSERRTVLKIAGRDGTHLIDGIETQIAAVRSIIDATSPEPIDIRGALCIADPEGLPILRTPSVRGIIVDGRRWVAKRARRPGPLTNEETAALFERLNAVLPSA
ncbi:MAG: nuclease-related domain-containing protein [Solirubrobacteraceae bacterium]